MTARRVRWFVVVAALAIVADRHGVTGQQAPALASVSGVVLTTEDPPRPVRRAIVSVRGSDIALGHHAITDDAGRFEIRDLPAGRYDLSAKRAAFVTIAYGASRPEWPGTPLALAAGQHLSGVTVRLAPGAIITGTVRDDTGAPAVGLEVRVERTTAAGGLFQRSARTDSQGAYRIYGLPPGTYTVRVQPLMTSADVTHARSDAEVDAILQQLQQGRFGAPQAIARLRGSRSPVSDFAPIYYPSAFTSEDASPVVLAAGEERAGVDMTIRLMFTARLAGRVVGSDGRVLGSGGVNLVRASRHAARPRGAAIRADGTFEFAAVSPGRYQLVTWRAASVGEATGPCEFAAANLEVTGVQSPDVLLAFRPCMKIAGRVEVAGDATPGATPAGLTGSAVRFEADRSSNVPMDTLLPLVATIGADGTFSVGGALQLVPGSYLIHANVPGKAPGTGWWLQSARTADGRDILDVPLTLTNSDPETTNVVLTFTDRHTSLSGSLVTAGGRPAIDYTIIAFTTNRDWWRPPFRRVLTARPATDGAFLLQDLPPGEYFLAALAQVAPNEWLDPAFLEQAASKAVRMTIGPGEQKVQSLQIRGEDVPRTIGCRPV
jgi:hypothetical protein